MEAMLQGGTSTLCRIHERVGGFLCASKLSPIPFLDAPAVTERDSFRPAGDAMVPLCWCCPPAPAPAMSRAAAPSYHFKSFCGEFERVESALERLEASGYYWGSLSGTEAKELLTSQPPGVFLVRDSSDHHHLFTLSVRTNTGITNLRIQQQGSAFHLEALPGAGHPPAFRCVVQLVEHYLRLGAVEGGPCYLEKEGQPPVPLALTHPLCCKVPALQELCQRAVRASVQGRGDARAQLQDLPVPRGLLNSLCS